MKQKVINRKNDVSEIITKRIILPYMGLLTNHLTSYLRRKLDCAFGYIPGKKIGQLIFNHKEKIERTLLGVYQIPCDCDAEYIGESERSMEIRLTEHERDVRKRNPKSAVASHIMENNSYHIKFDSASLLELEPRYFHRKFKEGLEIRRTLNVMNKDTGMVCFHVTIVDST